MNYNRVIMAGRLTRDPELSYLPNQTPIVKFSLATSRKYKGGDGQQKEDACFVDCEMFGKRAEVINQYLSKGDPLMIEGRLQFDRWDAQDGSKRSKHKIRVESFEFLGGSKERAEREPGGPPPADVPF